MEAEELLKGRRSIRKFRDEKISRVLMREVVDLCRWAPSWGNFQVARFTLIDDKSVIQKLAKDGVNDFVYNINSLKSANGVAVLSYVQGKSGKYNRDEYVTSKENEWEIFDAGIACQTFCLAAYEKGVGTCIMGIINDESISAIVGLPEEETVAALIVYGYEDGHPQPTKRFDVDEISRFI